MFNPFKHARTLLGCALALATASLMLAACGGGGGGPDAGKYIIYEHI